MVSHARPHPRRGGYTGGTMLHLVPGVHPSVRMDHALKALAAEFGGRPFTCARAAVAARDRMPSPRQLCPELVRAQVAGTGTYVLAPCGTSRPKGVAALVHGGAYVQGIDRHHLAWARFLCSLGFRVFVADYPLAPEHTAGTGVPAAAAWLQQVCTSARRDGLAVVATGDSAGAGLLVSAALAAGRTTPGPDLLVLVSPWTDVRCVHPLQPVLDRDDPVCSLEALRTAGLMWAGPLSPADPRVSPSLAAAPDLARLPRTLVVQATRDVLLPDVRLFVAGLDRSGVDVTYLEQSGAHHVYTTADGTPEADHARRVVAEFVGG